MWLEVVVSHDDAVVWSSGVWDPAAQSFARDPQLRTYAAIAQQHATGARFHVLLDDEWVSDTRIPPRGLVADLETDPVTDRYVLQDDGTWPHFDSHTYAFAGVPALADVDEGELSVVVRLLYLVNTPEYVEFLASENVTNSAGTDVAARFDEAGGAPPLVLAEHEFVIPIVDASPPADSSSGGDDTTTTTGGTSGETTSAEPGTSTSLSGGADTTGPAQGGGGEGCGCNTVRRSPWWLAVLLGIRRRRR